MEIASKTEKIKNLPGVPRAKVFGYLALLLSTGLCSLFVYAVFILGNGYYNISNIDLHLLNSYTFIAIALPTTVVTLLVIATGFWIGFTILTIKVVPPMPEIVEKKDYSKLKALILCLITLGLASLLIYGLYLKNYWAIAIPAAIITLVVLGAIFWVGIAIITTRATLPEQNKE